MPTATTAFCSICLSTAEVEAALDGRLTQVRRPLKPQPPKGYDRVAPEPPGYGFQWQNGGPLGTNPPHMELGMWTKKCKFGEPGGLLWVREPFKFSESDESSVVFPEAFGPTPVGFRSAALMPRLASRLTLIIHSVRAERLHTMAWLDYFAAGSPHGDPSCGACESDACLAHGNPRAWCHAQWAKVHGKHFPWATNPWCWILGVEAIPSR